MRTDLSRIRGTRQKGDIRRSRIEDRGSQIRTTPEPQQPRRPILDLPILDPRYPPHAKSRPARRRPRCDDRRHRCVLRGEGQSISCGGEMSVAKAFWFWHFSGRSKPRSSGGARRGIARPWRRSIHRVRSASNVSMNSGELLTIGGKRFAITHGDDPAAD